MKGTKPEKKYEEWIEGTIYLRPRASRPFDLELLQINSSKGETIVLTKGGIYSMKELIAHVGYLERTALDLEKEKETDDTPGQSDSADSNLLRLTSRLTFPERKEYRGYTIDFYKKNKLWVPGGK